MSPLSLFKDFVALSGLLIEYHSGLSKPLRSGLSKPLRSGLDLLHGGLVIYVSVVYHCLLTAVSQTTSWRFGKLLDSNKMAKENVLAPTRTDEQLVLVKARLPIRKSNLLMDLQKMQKNRIFRISVDILHNTNFFSAFTASTDVPSIYIQQFWNTLGKDSKTGVYSFQLDELWFNLNVDLLCKALGITPKDYAHPFVPPPAGDLDEWNEVLISKPIPKDLITDVIRYSGYYKKYLEMAACKPRQPTTVIDEEGGKKKKAPEAEDEEGQPASEPQVENDEYNLQRGIQMILESLQAPISGVVIYEPDPGVIRKLPEVEGKAKGIVSDRRSLITLDASTGPSTQPEDDTSANVVHDTSSPVNSTNDAETSVDTKKSTSKADIEILYVEEERGEEVSRTVDLEERTVELDEDLAGSDPGKTLESRPLPERVLIEEDQVRSNPGQSHVAQAGPNPEPMHKDFIATVYPHVHESLKLTTDKEVHIENPPSSSGTLSSMKNLEDAFTFGDQFLNEKSTKEVLGKANVETEVESMVIVPIHQASSLIPLLSNPNINLSPPKPVSPPVQETIFSTTTATTTTLPPPPPPLPQSTTYPDLATHLEHHDLYSKIDKQVSEVVKEAVHNALQDPLRERFKDLSKFQMKKIFHDSMFESNYYRSNLDHTTLSEALEESMQRDNNDELHEELTKSRKRRRDDQDPPPPPPKDSDQSKNKKHDLWIVVTLD
ncbi:hypothetical protein Tco_0482321 [Tanacetum coccineum]